VILFFFKSKKDDLIWWWWEMMDWRNAIDLLVAARDLGTGRTNWWRFYMGAGGSQMF
jgi:hypothetical protein